METQFDERCDQRLHLRVELVPAQEEGGLSGVIRELCSSYLLRVNGEYRRVVEENGDRAKPHVSLHSFADAVFFPEGRGQKSS